MVLGKVEVVIQLYTKSIEADVEFHDLLRQILLVALIFLRSMAHGKEWRWIVIITKGLRQWYGNGTAIDGNGGQLW